MSTKWTNPAIAGNQAIGVSQGTPEKFGVILLHGKNSFGDSIYSFLKITLSDLQRLRSAIQSGKGFNASDYGTIVAAGKGEPTPEIRAEVASMFEMIDIKKPLPAESDAASTPVPEEKKAWDEY